MKFDITVQRHRHNILYKWQWMIHAEGASPGRYFYDRIDNAAEHGCALTSASASRKAKRAARRVAAGKGGGRYEYKASGMKKSDRDDLMETIARLEEELGL